MMVIQPENTLNALEVCYLRRPAIPVPSLLYSLTPVGIGTLYVESLTGYIKRLATEHALILHSLMARIILPMTERTRLATSAALSGFWTKEAPALNGTCGWATSCVDILQRLTCRNDLASMTMLAWAEVLHSHSLIRRSGAWCPLCYEAWRSTQQIVYEPLLWTLQVVTMCPIHRHLLRTRCTACNQEQPHLAAQSRPGYCYSCGIWLGILFVDEDQLSHDDRQRRVWLAEAAGTLLTAAPQISQLPELGYFSRAIVNAISSRTNGSLSRMERQTGVARATLRGWQRGTVMPQLDSLLEFCRCLAIQPLSMLTDEKLDITITSQATRKPIAEPKRTYRSVDVGKLRMALTAIQLAEETPISMREASRRLECNQVSLQKWFPEE